MAVSILPINERWVSNDGLDFWQALTEALAKHGEQVQLG